MWKLCKTIAFMLCMQLLACTPAPEAPLVVASNDWIGYRPLYLAQHRNRLDKHTARLLQLTSASEVLRKFRNGVIHVAALTLDEALLLKQDGIDIKIIMMMDVSNGADAIVAHKKATDMNALRGKTIGVEKSAVGAYLLSRALEAANLSTRDIHIQPVEFGEHRNMFITGKVDAVVTFEPVRSHLLKQGAHVVFDSRQIPGEIVDVLVVSSEYLRQHADKLRSLMSAWFDTLHFMSTQRDQAVRYLAPLSNLSEESYLNAIQGIHFPGYRENLQFFTADKSDLYHTAEKLQAVMYSQQLLRKTVVPETLFDSTLLKQLNLAKNITAQNITQSPFEQTSP
jgi:NitT/TauT family transport system substrate-binding protein